MPQQFAISDPEDKDDYIVLINFQGEIRYAFDSKAIARLVQKAHDDQVYVDGWLPVRKKQYEEALVRADEILDDLHHHEIPSFRDNKSKSEITFLILQHVRHMPGFAKLNISKELDSESKQALIHELMQNKHMTAAKIAKV